MYIFHICPLLDERSVQGVSPTALHSGLVSFPPRSSQLVDGRTAFQLILPLLTTSLCRTLQAPPGHPWTCPSPRRRPRSPSTGPRATLAEVPSPDSSSRPEPQVSRARGGGRALCMCGVGGAELSYTKPQRAAFMRFIKTRCAIKSAAIF